MLDPPLPKAPASAFALFCAQHRDSIKQTLQESDRNRKPQLGEIQRELASQWKKLAPEVKQKFSEELDILRVKQRDWQQAHQQGEATAQQQLQSLASGASKNEFPQTRINRIVKLDPCVKKISAEAARFLNLATVAALRQFTTRTLAGRESDKLLTVDDVLAMIRRGGPSFKFLQSCTYAVVDDEDLTAQDPVEAAVAMQIDLSDSVAPWSGARPLEPVALSRTLPVKPRGGGGSARGKRGSRAGSEGAQMRTADIASFFRRS